MLLYIYLNESETTNDYSRPKSVNSPRQVSMFKVGDTIIHPKLGACRVEEVKTQTILEKKHKCLVLIPLFENRNNLKICLPAENSNKVGLRKPAPMKTIEEIRALLSEKVDGKEINGQEISLTILKNKLASGDPLKIAEIVRDLTAKIRQDGGKYASARRRSFLKTTQKRLIREISLSTGLTLRQTTIEIRSILRG